MDGVVNLVVLFCVSKLVSILLNGLIYILGAFTLKTVHQYPIWS